MSVTRKESKTSSPGCVEIETNNLLLCLPFDSCECQSGAADSMTQQRPPETSVATLVLALWPCEQKTVECVLVASPAAKAGEGTIAATHSLPIKKQFPRKRRRFSSLKRVFCSCTRRKTKDDDDDKYLDENPKNQEAWSQADTASLCTDSDEEDDKDDDQFGFGNLLPSLVRVVASESTQDVVESSSTLARVDERTLSGSSRSDGESWECLLPQMMVVVEVDLKKNSTVSLDDDDEDRSSTIIGHVEKGSESERRSTTLTANNNSNADTSSCSSSSTDQAEDGDDAWLAAKRGDLLALQHMARRCSHDWTRADAFSNTPLYYACHSGVASGGLPLVQFVLTHTSDLPEAELERCKKNALHPSVVRLLEGNLTETELNEKSGDMIESNKREEHDTEGLGLLFEGQDDW